MRGFVFLQNPRGDKKYGIAALTVLLMFTLFPMGVCAGSLPALSEETTEYKSGSTAERDYLAELEAAIPEEYRQAFSDIDTETLVGAEYLFSLAADSIRKEGGKALSLLAMLIGIVVLGSVATLLMQEEKSGTRGAVSLLITAVSAIAVYGALAGTVKRVGAYLGDLLHFINGASPVLTALLAAGGSVGAASASAGAFSLGALLLENLLIGVLTPLAGVCTALALIGVISPELKPDGITRNVRWVYMTLLGVASTLAGAGLALQTTIAAAGDSLAMRSAKYAVGNMIPLVGGSIGAALGTLTASLATVKSVVGVSGVAVLLLMTLPVLVYLLLTRLAVSVAGAVAGLFGFSAGEILLAEFRRLFDMLLAMTAAAGVTFMIYFAVFLKVAYPAVIS